MEKGKPRIDRIMRIKLDYPEYEFLVDWIVKRQNAVIENRIKDGLEEPGVQTRTQRKWR